MAERLQWPSVVACGHCGVLHLARPDRGRWTATCRACGAVVHGSRPGSVERAAALQLAAVALLAALPVLPVLTPGAHGEPAALLDVLRGLLQGGAWPLALALAAVVLVVPLVRALLALRLVVAGDGETGRAGRVASLVWFQRLAPWSMVAVLLLAVLVAALLARGGVEPVPGVGLAVLAAAAILLTWAEATFEPVEAWARIAPQNRAEILRPSAGTGLSVCRTCGQVARHTDRSRQRLTALCPRCGEPLDPGPDRRGQAAAAWIAGAAVLYVVAHLVPVAVGPALAPATIADALATIASSGADPVATAILIAAIALPVATLIGVGLLASTVGPAPLQARARRVRLHRALVGVTPLAMLAVLALAWTIGATAPAIAAGPAAVCLTLAVAQALIALDRLDPRPPRPAQTPEEADVPSARA